MTKKSSNLADENWCAALSYLFIGIIWFILDDKMRKNSFVKFHVKQGLVLLIAVIILQILSVILFILIFVWWLVGVLLFVLGIIGLIYALDNKQKPVPFLGTFAKKFKF